MRRIPRQSSISPRFGYAYRPFSLGDIRLSMVQLALRRPYTFIVMAMLIVLATPFALLNMATDIFPEINIPVISVIWNYNGLSAQEMGQRIAAQNERGLTTTVSDIEHIESQSLASITVIKIFFQPSANIQAAIAQVVASEQTQEIG